MPADALVWKGAMSVKVANGRTTIRADREGVRSLQLLSAFVLAADGHTENGENPRVEITDPVSEDELVMELVVS